MLSPLGSLAPMVPPSFSGPATRSETEASSSTSAPETLPRTQASSSGATESSRPAREGQKGSESRDRSNAPNGQGLSEEALRTLSQLKARDREVRAHESAHQAAGGQYAGSISYVYQRGPDGAQYAVGGEVSIDVSPVAGDPQATIEKMRIVRAAALAPAQPSGQDRAVAAEAMQQMLQAQSELAVESQQDNGASVESKGDSGEAGALSRAGTDATNTYQQVDGLASDAMSSRTPVLDAIA